MLNFSAIVPNFWKTGLIKCMLNSAKMICSSEDLFDKEVEKLKKMFAANGYPKAFFERTLEKFSLSKNEVKSDADENEPTDRRHIFGIPWVGNISRDYKQKVTELIKQHLEVDISSYYTSCKVSSYFSLKSSTPFALKARVVYQYTLEMSE